MTREHIIAMLLRTAARVDELSCGLSEEQLSWKPDAGTFSIRENIWHVRDIDAEGFMVRLDRILSEDCPPLADVDGAKLARERGYNDLPLAPALHDLAAMRAKVAAILGNLDSAQSERTAELQGAGTITLLQLLERWLRHDAEHLADLESLRAALDSGQPPQRSPRAGLATSQAGM